ncbi:MAG: hypothetical protein IPL69_20135 [Saprospiraceae bacterium]|nr:hypothetical protein [Candidatus Brachybacter algidus]
MVLYQEEILNGSVLYMLLTQLISSKYRTIKFVRCTLEWRKVNIQCGVAITYVPFNTVTYTTPNANAGTNKVLDCNNSTVVLNGSSSTPNVNFLWAASNGGSISSNGNTATPTVSTVGTYTLTVTTQTGGCTATSSVVVTSNTTSPDVNAGPDIATDCAIPEGSLSGSSTTANAQFAWTTYGNGFIVSGAGSSSPVVNTGGNYVLTVTDPANGCSANDTAFNAFTPCIFPGYPPPDDGKTYDLIGSELNSLYQNFGAVNDTSRSVFFWKTIASMLKLLLCKDNMQACLHYYSPLA